ncbi:MAG: hypothetical protein ACW98D_16800, partial [Promethearchaeota archaeon]
WFSYLLHFGIKTICGKKKLKKTTENVSVKKEYKNENMIKEKDTGFKSWFVGGNNLSFSVST